MGYLIILKREKIVRKFLFNPDIDARPHIFSFQETNVTKKTQPWVDAALYSKVYLC